MLLAIDVGNSQTVFAAHDGQAWRGVWRRDTNTLVDPAELCAWLGQAFESFGLAPEVDRALCVSVVSAAEAVLVALCELGLGVRLEFLRSREIAGLNVLYDPPSSVGADRLANALGAAAKYGSPVLAIDFGTATKFDAVDANGAFVGGAIMPGFRISAEALFDRAPRLPRVELLPPSSALGQNTVHALQSGIVLGYAGAVEALAKRIRAELGAGRVIATGGLGAQFVDLCPVIELYDPTLTLDGLLAALDQGLIAAG